MSTFCLSIRKLLRISLDDPKCQFNRLAFHSFSALLLLFLPMLIFSCSEENDLPSPGTKGETPGNQPPVESLTLIYAVASNNLESFLKADTLEMVKAAQDIDLQKNVVLLYAITRGKNPSMKRLVRSEKKDKYFFVTVKEYSNDIFSTDPGRVSQVISDALDFGGDAQSRGIVFWSHAGGWTFEGSDHVKPGKAPAQRDAIQFAFGQDNSNGTSDKCDIDELADAIPEGVFNYVWFDCCYMGSVEVAYQFRDKSPYFIGYPTEIGADGMPYDETLSLLASTSPKLVQAADVLYSYYNGRVPVTVGVYRTDKLPRLARAYSDAADIRLTSFMNIHNYARRPFGPFYDLGQLAEAQDAAAPGVFSLIDFKNALNDVVLYKAASELDFSNNRIDASRYSGITVHHFIDNNSADSEFYKSLDWYKATRGIEDHTGVPSVRPD